MRHYLIPLAVALLIGGAWAIAQETRSRVSTTPESAVAILDAPKQRVEIGLVRWGRDLVEAQRLSKASGKPILVLFQEVPGCAGCQKFGREVLSHPLIVDAIQNEFVPVLVYNNRSNGDDALLLKRFNEPAWNYQVLRFLDSDAKDVVPRKDQVWTVDAVARRLVFVLTRVERRVPKYLDSLVLSTGTQNQQLAALAMNCFWTGEYELGQIEGVAATEAGWFDGREVTLVRYDPARLSLKSLTAQAARLRCAEKIYTSNGRADGALGGGRLMTGKLDQSYRAAAVSDQKRQLGRWPSLTRVPAINATQLTKLNAVLPRDRTAALEWLSPSQRRWLTQNAN